MDKPRTTRTAILTPRRLAAAALAAFVCASLAGMALVAPGAPAVSRQGLWIGTVKQGDMLREVRGQGSLVPKEFRWIAAETPARVDRIVVRPGATVTPETIIIEMENSTLLEQQTSADAALRAAQAEYTARQAMLDSEALARQAQLASVQTEYEQARLLAEAQRMAFERGATPLVQRRSSELLAQSQQTRLDIERRRGATFARTMQAQLAAERARIAQLESTAGLYARQVAALKVRAGIAGVVQEIAVETGQQIAAGTNLARVANPDALMAQLRVAETQIREVVPGSDVLIDLRDSVMPGRVVRVDPAVRNGTVLVDVDLVGPVSASARADLTVDGAIRVEELNNVLFLERPANVQPGAEATLFRLDADGAGAQRTAVLLGKSSAGTIEIVRGLAAGDRVVISETAAWQAYPRISLE